MERHARARTILDALPEAERTLARVIAALVEGEGILKMLSDAERALTHLKQSALSRDIKTALASQDADPDLLVLGCAYHWNAAVVHRVLDVPGWQKELKTSEGYCTRAMQRDPEVVGRSPVAKLVTPPDQVYRLANSQGPSAQSKAPSGAPPSGAAGFSFGSAVTDVVRVCKDAKFVLTGVKKEGLRCSGAPVNMGFPAVVRLRFCEEELCRIDVIQKLDGDDPSGWLTQHEQRRRDLETAYGPAGRTVHRISPECTESIAWCLSNRKLQLEDAWAWLPDKTGVFFRMDRIDNRGILKMTFERK